LIIVNSNILHLCR